MANYEENTLSSLLNVALRYKWLLFVPLVITLLGIYIYTFDKKLYQSAATISFQTEYFFTQRNNNALSPFERDVQDLVASLKYGKTLETITAKAYPKINPKKQRKLFKAKASKLGAKNGLKLSFRRDNFRALVISYTASDAAEAHSVVKATINTILDNANITSDRVQKSIAFLESSMAGLKTELLDIDQEMLRLKNGLAPLVGAAANVGAIDSVTQSSLTPDLDSGLQRSFKFKESLPQLEFDLHVKEKEFQRLEEKLKNKEYLKSENSSETQNQIDYQNDTLYNQLEASILEKKKELHILTSQGFKSAHPKQRTVKAEIANLQKLSKTRLEELQNTDKKGGLSAYRLSIEKEIKKDLGLKASEIESIKDKIKVLESYQEDIRSQKNSFGSKLDSISVQKSRLEELIQKKYVKSQAYNNAAQEVEEVRRFAQASAGEMGLKITIENPPYLPNAPIPYAHLSLFVMGAILSLGLGMGIVFLIESMDTSVDSPAELQAIIGVPVIGSIDKFHSEVDTYRIDQVDPSEPVSLMALCLVFGHLLSNTII